MWSMGRWWSMWRLDGDRNWSSTCGTWDCGGQCGNWGTDDDLWNGDWSSAGGDDGLSGDGDRTSTGGTWNGGGQCGNWSRNNDLWDGDWRSTGGDDGLSGDRHWSSTCGTWDGSGQGGNWMVIVTGAVHVEHGTVVVNVETGW
ncbi:unnamed protein product [[Candida] boidinii]|nr:unnamed protein product [[Candida] boidinii]